MGGWICGGSDLDYPKIQIKMVEINWREIYWNEALGYLNVHQHASWAKYFLLMPIKSWRGVSTPHEPHSNQYGTKDLSYQIIITLY